VPLVFYKQGETVVAVH